MTIFPSRRERTIPWLRSARTWWETSVCDRSAIQARSQNTQLGCLEQGRRQHQAGRIGARARLSRRAISLFGCEPVLAQPLGHLQVEAEELAAIISHRNIQTFVPMS
jgi:hypothetical protein